MNVLSAVAAPLAIAVTRENAREEFMRAVVEVCGSGGGRMERERMLEILRKTDCRDIFVNCMNEEAVIRAFTDASSIDHVELVIALHDIGMNVDAKNQYGGSVLRNASYNGHEECVRWLLDHNANVEIQDNFGSTPLSFASINGRVTIVEMLLQKNANPDLQDTYGTTPLMSASQHGYNEIVQVLLSYNANTDLKDNKEKTALDLAKNEEVKEMLLNHVSNSYLLK